jgi:nucleoside-diphosphate-sugar epimerase
MMRILVIGGTRFVGRHFVDQALERGHDLTIFHRGATGAHLFPDVEHRFGDRNSDLSALGSGVWDATVDTCAYVPRQVDQLAGALGDRGGHHLVVSSVSVYATPDGAGVAEDAPMIRLPDPTVEEISGGTYGGLKVLCEEAAVERHGESTLLVRPTYVIGPDDHTWRFPWWVTRIARGGAIAVPGPRDTPAQVIDARDLGAWMVRLLEDGRSGPFNACGPRIDFTWGEQIDATVSAVAPPDTEITWIDPDVLLGHDLGSMAFPLWAGVDADRWIMTCDPARAIDAGLTFRPLERSVTDTLAWARESTPVDGIGLSRDQERLLLDA